MLKTEKTNAVIIEDETNSRELLANMLQNYCNSIEVVGEAHDVKTGIAVIQKYNPDVIFLDIEMPGGDGFKILDAFPIVAFQVIFVTGYDEYAIKAIKYSALDYILKPIDLEELKNAIKKIIPSTSDKRQNIKFLQSSLKKRQKEPDKLILPGNKRHVVVPFNQIIKIIANGNYAEFFLEGNKIRISSYSLAHYESILPEGRFLRIHKSHLINLQKVTTYQSGRGGKVFLSDGSSLDIAARKKSAFVRMLNNMAR